MGERASRDGVGRPCAARRRWALCTTVLASAARLGERRHLLAQLLVHGLVVMLEVRGEQVGHLVVTPKVSARAPHLGDRALDPLDRGEEHRDLVPALARHAAAITSRPSLISPSSASRKIVSSSVTASSPRLAASASSLLLSRLRTEPKSECQRLLTVGKR